MNRPTPTITTDEIDAFEPQAKRLLWALLGHSQALVTDLSDLGDFMPWPGRAEPELLAAVAELVGHPVTVNDRLVDLAHEMAQADQERNARRH